MNEGKNQTVISKIEISPNSVGKLVFRKFWSRHCRKSVVPPASADASAAARGAGAGDGLSAADAAVTAVPREHPTVELVYAIAEPEKRGTVPAPSATIVNSQEDHTCDIISWHWK